MKLKRIPFTEASCKIKQDGAKFIEFTPPKVKTDGDLTILIIAMRNDHPQNI